MIVELARKAPGKKPTKVAFIGDNTASSVSFMKPIRDHAAKDLGLTIVADEVYTPPLTDATTLVQHVRSGRPDFMVFQSTNVPRRQAAGRQVRRVQPAQRPAAEDRRRRSLGGAGAAEGRRAPRIWRA